MINDERQKTSYKSQEMSENLQTVHRRCPEVLTSCPVDSKCVENNSKLAKIANNQRA